MASIPTRGGLALLLWAGSLSACGGGPPESSDVAALTVGESTLTEIETPPEFLSALAEDPQRAMAEAAMAAAPSDAGDLGDADSGDDAAEIDTDDGSGASEDDGSDLDPTKIIDGMVRVGKKIWTVIADNQPVVNVERAATHVLPPDVESPMELAGFSSLQARTFRASGRNLYGITVYDVTFSVVHQYGGSQDGRGQYLAAVAVVPHNLDVAWGYKVGLRANQLSVSNAGSSEDPIAQLALGLEFKVNTILKHHEETLAVNIRGDDARARLAGESRAAAVAIASAD